MVAWTQVVQSHSDYSLNLQRYVDGEIEDLEFIDLVSDIIGCQENERMKMRANFESALNVLVLSPS